jgi:SPW repeat
MPAAKLSLPKQWTDWTTWLLGIWLLLSPVVLVFDFETPAMRNAVVVGALIIAIEVVELTIFRGWEEWINVALGAWLLVSAWVLSIVTPSARANFVLVGLLVVGLALYELWHPASQSERDDVG